MSDDSYEARKIAQLERKKEDYLDYVSKLNGYIESFDDSRKKIVESKEHFGNVYVDGKPFMTDKFEDVEADMLQSLTYMNICLQYANNSVRECQASIDELKRKMEGN